MILSSGTPFFFMPEVLFCELQWSATMSSSNHSMPWLGFGFSQLAMEITNLFSIIVSHFHVRYYAMVPLSMFFLV